MKALQERDRSLQEVYSDLYNTTHNEIVKELESYHHRYGNALGLSPQEASLRVSQYDVEAFANKAKRYVQTKDFSDKANRELKMYNYALRARRDELLQASIQLSMLELQAREEALTERNILKEGLAEYERQAGIMGMSVPDVETMKQTIKVLSQTSYQGATWSDRIWQRQNVLQQHVMNIVEDVALRGKSPLEYVTKLRKVFDVGAYEARRLAVTESCRVQTGVQKEVYLNNDFQYYVWSPEPSACPICAAMKGQSFRTTDMQPGVNAPPMHPHCHCTTAPDVNREREKLEEMFKEYEEEQFEFIDRKDLPQLIKQSGKISQKDRHIIYDKAFGYIQSNNSFKINYALRTNQTYRLTDRSQETIRVLDKVISDNSLSTNIRTVRYVDGKVIESILEQNSEFFPGESISTSEIVKVFNNEKLSFREKGYTSVSLIEENNVFKQFRPVKCVIDVPSNANSFVTENTLESEMIIHRDSEYDIIGAKQEGNQLIVHLKMRK